MPSCAPAIISGIWFIADSAQRARLEVAASGSITVRRDAISANSPFVDGRDSGLHTARTQIFTRMFPRCGIPDSFGDWDSYERYVRFLYDTGSITEHTQLWWSVRPHLAFPTVEIRICDGQPEVSEAQSLAAFAAFNAFYLFAGAPTLRKIPYGTRGMAFVAPAVATLVLARRWRARLRLRRWDCPCCRESLGRGLR